jgi:hypothetical protein
VLLSGDQDSGVVTEKDPVAYEIQQQVESLQVLMPQKHSVLVAEKSE